MDAGQTNLCIPCARSPSVAGYRASVAFDGETFAVTNEHKPSARRSQGHKVWSGDNEDVRPRSIEVELLANGGVFGAARSAETIGRIRSRICLLTRAASPSITRFARWRSATMPTSRASRVRCGEYLSSVRRSGDFEAPEERGAAREQLRLYVQGDVRARWRAPCSTSSPDEVTGRGVNTAAPRTGTIATDGTFTLKAGQTAHQGRCRRRVLHGCTVYPPATLRWALITTKHRAPIRTTSETLSTSTRRARPCNWICSAWLARP